MWLSCFCLSVICKILRSTKQLHMSRVEKIRADHHADTVSCCYDFTMTNFMRWEWEMWRFEVFQSWVLLCQESWLLLHTSQEDLQIIFRPENILLSLLCLWDKTVVVSVFMNILIMAEKRTEHQTLYTRHCIANVLFCCNFFKLSSTTRVVTDWSGFSLQTTDVSWKR